MIAWAARRGPGRSTGPVLVGARRHPVPEGSGTEQNALQVLEAHGLKPADLAQAARIDTAQAVTQMRGGQLDAAPSEGAVTIEKGLIVTRAPGAPVRELRLRPVPLTRHRLVLPSGRALDLGMVAEPGNVVRLTVR